MKRTSVIILILFVTVTVVCLLAWWMMGRLTRDTQRVLGRGGPYDEAIARASGSGHVVVVEEA